MDLPLLKAEISKKTKRALYIFTGPELGIMDIYIQKLQELHCASVKRVDSVSGVYSKLHGRGVLNVAQLYIIRDDREFQQEEKVWKDFESLLEQTGNAVILIYSSIDKRGKFYKHYTDMIVDFALLETAMLAKYVKRELPMLSDANCKTLAELSVDYSRLLLECDKIRHLWQAVNKEAAQQGADVSYDEVFLGAMYSKLIYSPPGDVLFEMTDAVCYNDIHRAWRLLAQLKAVQEPPVKILSILYNNFRSILLVQGLGANPKDICASTGLTPWQAKLAREKTGYYSIGELVQAIRTIREAEKGIKTGKIDQEIAVEYCLVNIMS